MWPDLFSPMLLALLAVGYVFVSAVLAVLTGAIRNQTERHDIIRSARQRRADYLQRVSERQQQQNL